MFPRTIAKSHLLTCVLGGSTEALRASLAKPELLHKLEGSSDEVNGAVLIPGQSRSPCRVVHHKVLALEEIF